MRRISANYIYLIESEPIKNGIVELDNSNRITKIIDTQGKLQESRNLEFYNGVIVPGFVNSHCHLELSYLKNKLPENIGLPQFLASIVQFKKEESSNTIRKSIELFDTKMRANGIVAVGDICNTINTISVKEKSKIVYYNFIEAIGRNSNSREIFEYNKNLYKSFIDSNLKASITPHAPYSVSNELMSLIKNEAEVQSSILSIHNQETESENELFENGTGELITKLKSFGVSFDNFKSSGINSINTISELLPQNNHIIFVHNTFSNLNDIEAINSKFENSFWCLCPSSNLYIENSLPNIELFLDFSDKVTLGTDSLASNKGLSILDEMKVINAHYPEINFETLIRWATINGAKALMMDSEFGTISVGKAPGLNLITDFDFTTMQLKNTSGIKVLV
jgi:cytosine/adenosine deaminase-related metal-dependent hydrolase